MNIHLIQTQFRGIRNIGQETTISFYPKQDLSDFDESLAKVRVLYGPNGSGKSSIVLSFWFVQQLFLSENFLARCSEYAPNLLNKTNPVFQASLTYYVNEVPRPALYTYSVLVRVNELGLQLEWEKLERHEKLNLKANRATIFATDAGRLVEFRCALFTEWEQEFKEAAINRVTNTSFLHIFRKVLSSHALANRLLQEQLDMEALGLSSFISLMLKFSIAINPSDRHLDEINFRSQLAKRSATLDDATIRKVFFEPMLLYRNGETIVLPSQMKDYESFVARQGAFMKLFKPELIDIHIDSGFDGTYYHCRQKFVYNGYYVDFEYESAGIKKLAELFGHLEAAANGAIAIIDEMDANVSGVYLQKLVTFFEDHGKGQLFFSAHSLEPMRVLSNRATKSIHFLGEGNQMYLWTKNAHYKPDKLYVEGMIPGAPFNLESFDFLPYLMRG